MVLERSKCTVLLIDDEQAGLHLRKLVLGSAGFKTLTATTPEDAMELFRLHDVDVVVTDHLLGRATAAGLAGSMKRLKPHVPIISLSGTTRFDEALKYADHFIGKAEGPETLIHTLDEVLVHQVQEFRLVPVEKPDLADDLPKLALLAAIVEDSTDAILSKNMNGIITSWNHAAEKMYGYLRDEVIGKPITMLLPPDRPDEVTHILGRLKRGERISHFETVRLAKGGRELDVSLTLSPIRDGSGRIIGASTIARDVTEQKNASEALRKAEKLALAGRMAATVAHEINNPLESINNILYLLRNVVELSDEARTYVATAQEELKRVSEITTLTLGMQRGTVDRRESLKLTTLLDGVLTLYQRRTKTLGVRVTQKYDYQGPIFGFPGELRQVFSNLIVNAMDALSIRGDMLEVRVRCSRRWDTGEKGVRVSIMDNGPGIAKEHRSKLFQVFHTTKGEQGTGIGLWISKAIVTKHGGTMRVRSSVQSGKTGTCFSVFLPMGQQVQASQAA